MVYSYLWHLTGKPGTCATDEQAGTGWCVVVAGDLPPLARARAMKAMIMMVPQLGPSSSSMYGITRLFLLR